MRWLFAAVLAGGCWTSAPPPEPVAPKPPRRPLRPQAEHWMGVGHQYDDDSHWRIDLVIDPDAKVGERLGIITYPTLGCRAELLREPDRDDDLIALEHVIIDPEQHCIDNGMIVIPKRRGVSFHWRWKYPESGEEGADAELSRVIPEDPRGPHR